MLGGVFKLWLFPLFIAILDSTGHAGWQYGKTVKRREYKLFLTSIEFVSFVLPIVISDFWLQLYT